MENALENVPQPLQDRSWPGSKVSAAGSLVKQRGKPFLNSGSAFPTVRTITEAAATAGILRHARVRSRVLVLPGLGSSAAMSEDMLTWSLLQLPNRADLSDMLDITCVDGPFKAPMTPALIDFFPNSMPAYTWEDSSKPKASRWEEAVGTVVRHNSEHGPFDAMLGVSQGSVLAVIVLRLQQQGAIHTNFKFAICSMMPDIPSFLGAFSADVLMPNREDRISTPVAFLYHLDDSLAYKPPLGITETKHFSTVFVARDSVGGHSMPHLVGEGALEQLCSFIRTHMSW